MRGCFALPHLLIGDGRAFIAFEIPEAHLGLPLKARLRFAGTWRGVLEDVQRAEELTSRDIREVAAATFAPDNCFTGYVLPLKQVSAVQGR